MVLSPEEVKDILGERVDKLRLCMETAWERYQNFPPEVKVDLSARSRASVVYDFIIREAWNQFMNDSDVHLDQRRGFLLINVLGMVLIRFKKFNKRLLPQSIPTNQNMVFMERGQGILLECVTATKLIAGYQLNNLQSNIQLMAMVCPDGNTCELYFELDKPSIAETVPLRDYGNSEEKQRISAKEGLENEDRGGQKI
jgi:hypothetical protein